MDPDQINELSGNSQVPLAFRMMEDLPGFASSFFFAQHRGSNTLLRGGFMDDRLIGPGKLGGFKRGSLSPTLPTEKAYYGRRGFLNLDDVSPGRAMRLAEKHGVPVKGGRVARRATRLAEAAGSSEGKMAFGKGARVNHITARPRALSRYNSLTMFNASQNTPFYSPFQALAGMVDKRLAKSSTFKNAVYGSKEAVPEEQMMQRGMVSMITAGRKADILERKAAAGSGRAATKVAKAQEQVKRLALMNNPGIAESQMVVRGKTYEFGRVLKASQNAGIVAPPSSSISYRGTGTFGESSFMGKALAGEKNVGLTGNLMASAGSSQASRFVQGYFRGALGNINAGGLTGDALSGAGRAVTHMEKAIFKGIGSPSAHLGGEALEKGVFKTLGSLEGGALKNVFRTLATKEGSMVLGARTAAMAIPGLNLLATASLVYDLGKMGGELVKSGVGLAKDAVKSMKGSIDKPMFGMGYKDNEIAATSRARGVMAIQNSRLNARSMLGSEAGMMAAHFG